MSGTELDHFLTSATNVATVPIDLNIAEQVVSELSGNITNLIVDGNAYISAAVTTLAVTNGTAVSLATPPAGFVVQNYALVTGQGDADVTVPDYDINTGSGYRGAIVNAVGSVTITGGDPKNGLFVFGASSNVTFNAEGGVNGTNTIYGGGGNNNITINGVSDDVILGGGNNTVTAAENVAGGGTYGYITAAGGNNVLNLIAGNNAILSQGNDTIFAGGATGHDQMTVTGTSLVYDQVAGDDISVSGAATVYATGANDQVTAGAAATVYNIAIDDGAATLGMLVAQPSQVAVQTFVDNFVNQPQQANGPQAVDIVTVSASGGTIAQPTATGLPILFLTGAAGGVTSVPASDNFSIIFDNATGYGTVLGGDTGHTQFIASAQSNVTYDSEGLPVTILGGGGIDNFTIDGPRGAVSLGGGTNTITVSSINGANSTSFTSVETGGGQSTISLFTDQNTVVSGGQDRILTYSNNEKITVTGTSTFVGLRAGTHNNTVTASGNADTVNVVGTSDVVDATALSGNGYVFVTAAGQANVTMGGAGTFLTVGTGSRVTGTGAAIDDFGDNTSMSVDAGLLSEYGTNGRATLTGTATTYINGRDNTATLSDSTAAYGKTIGSTFNASGHAQVVLGQLNGNNQVFLSGNALALVHGDSIVAGGNDLIVTADGNNAMSVTGTTGSVLFANGGQDTVDVSTALSVFGGAATLSIAGGNGNLIIVQGSGAVSATGGTGAATLFGGTSGNNMLIGGSGDSNLLVAAGASSTLVGGSGVTTMLGSGGVANTFIAGSGTETMTGAAFAGSSNSFVFGAQSASVSATVTSFGNNSSITLSDGVTLTAPLGPLAGTSETLALSNGGSITLIGLTQQLTAASIVGGGSVLR